MHGHKDIRVRPGYFTGGYVADLLQMTSKGEDYMLRTQDAYSTSKLVSVDVFGRLFAYGESLEKVNDRISQFITLHAG